MFSWAHFQYNNILLVWYQVENIHNDKGTLVLLGVSVGFVAGWEEFDLSFLVCFLYNTILFETVILIPVLFYCACCFK